MCMVNKTKVYHECDCDYCDRSGSVEDEHYDCEYCEEQYRRESEAKKCEQNHREKKDKHYERFIDYNSKLRLFKAGNHKNQVKLK